MPTKAALWESIAARINHLVDPPVPLGGLFLWSISEVDPLMPGLEFIDPLVLVPGVPADAPPEDPPAAPPTGSARSATAATALSKANGGTA